MEENEILKAARHCATEELCDGCPLSGYAISFCAEKFARYILTDKENEPAPAATETSSAKENTVYLDDNTLFEICQETLAKISGNYSSRTGNCDFVRGYAKAVCDIIDKLKAGAHDVKD